MASPYGNPDYQYAGRVTSGPQAGMPRYNYVPRPVPPPPQMADPNRYRALTTGRTASGEYDRWKLGQDQGFIPTTPGTGAGTGTGGGLGDWINDILGGVGLGGGGGGLAGAARNALGNARSLIQTSHAPGVMTTPEQRLELQQQLDDRNAQGRATADVDIQRQAAPDISEIAMAEQRLRNSGMLDSGNLAARLRELQLGTAGNRFGMLTGLLGGVLGG